MAYQPYPGDLAATGSLAVLNATVSVTTAGRGVTAVELTGTWVGTVTFQATSDPAGVTAVDANWYTVNAPAPTVAVPGSSTSANGLFRVNSAGYTAVRVRMTSYTSGTATAWLNASASSSLTTLAEPVTIGADPDTVLSGTLSATDAVVAAPAGDGSFRTGTSTAASYLSLLCPGGDSSWIVQLTGAFGGGTVYFEGSADSTNGLDGNWINLNGRQTGVVNTVLSGGAAAAGFYRGNTSGTKYLRVRLAGATAPSIAVVMRVSSAPGALFLNASIPAGTNSIGTVQQAALAKGTQGATGVSTQDLKDAGRNPVHYYTVIPVLTSATDTLLSLTGTKSGATVATTTTPAQVTTGKTFRVTRLSAAYISTTASGYAVVRLRFNTAGAVAITSPVAATVVIGNSAPTTANATEMVEATLSEGWEFAAVTGVGISAQGFAAVTASAVGYVMVSLTGFEY